MIGITSQNYPSTSMELLIFPTKRTYVQMLASHILITNKCGQETVVRDHRSQHHITCWKRTWSSSVARLYSPSSPNNSNISTSSQNPDYHPRLPVQVSINIGTVPTQYFLTSPNRATTQPSLTNSPTSTQTPVYPLET